MTEEAVTEAMNKVLSKLHDEKNRKRFRRWNKTISFTFTDLDKSWHTILTEGVPSDLIEGLPEEKSDIFIKTDSETWVKIRNKEIKALKAYNDKLIKIKGSTIDLIKLQRAL